MEPRRHASEGTAAKAQVSRELILDHSSGIAGKDAESIFYEVKRIEHCY